MISDRTGTLTVSVTSESRMLGTWRVSNYTPEYREASSIGKRQLLTVDEVLRFPLDEALVILRGQKVLRVNKYDYSNHPDYKKLRPVNIADYEPEWINKPFKEVDVMGRMAELTTPSRPNSRRGSAKPSTPRSTKPKTTTIQEGGTQLVMDTDTGEILSERKGGAKGDVSPILTQADRDSIMS